MGKIVLYNPKPNFDLKSKDISLALLFISKMLAIENYEIKIFSDFDDREAMIAQCSDAICFGITSMTGYQIKDGLYIASLIKRFYPKVPIVWGGWHASLLPEQTLENDNVDIVVRGQGEKTFY